MPACSRPVRAYRAALRGSSPSRSMIEQAVVWNKPLRLRPSTRCARHAERIDRARRLDAFDVYNETAHDFCRRHAVDKDPVNHRQPQKRTAPDLLPSIHGMRQAPDALNLANQETRCIGSLGAAQGVAEFRGDRPAPRRRRPRAATCHGAVRYPRSGESNHTGGGSSPGGSHHAEWLSTRRNVLLHLVMFVHL